MDTALKNLLSGKGDKGTLLPRMQRFVYDEVVQSRSDPAADKRKVAAECVLAAAYFVERDKQFRTSAARDRSAKKYHPSSLSGCKRALIFSLFGAAKNQPYDREGEYRGQMIFSNGDYVHLRLQVLLHRMGLLKQWEVPLECAELNMEGHCDGELDIDGERTVLEIKSINSRGFDEVQRGGPRESHVWQVNCYMRMSGMRSAIILYENKDTQTICECRVPRSAEIIKDIEQHVRDVEGFRKRRCLPPREGDGPACKTCKWCDYSSVCYSESKVSAFTSKMKGVTHEDQDKQAARPAVRKTIRIAAAGSRGAGKVPAGYAAIRNALRVR